MTLYVRDFPPDLMKELDDYAAKVAGTKSIASRPKTVISLLRQAIAAAKRER